MRNRYFYIIIFFAKINVLTVIRVEIYPNCMDICHKKARCLSVIRSTTDPTFLRFGTPVSPQTAEHSEMKELSLSAAETLPLYCFDRPTLWEHSADMTVLLVVENDCVHRFYLDRAVQLHAGIRFGFAPLQGASRISCEAELQSEAFCVGSMDAPDFTAALQPMRIFTCMSQKAENGFYFRGEQHLPMELVWLKRGTMHNYCGGEDLLLRAKELLLIPSGQWHMQYADETVQFLTLSFFWEGRDFQNLSGSALKLSNEAERYLISLEQELLHERADKDEFMHATLKLLLLHLQRQADSAGTVRRPSPSSEQVQRRIIEKAMQAVSANIRGRYAVPELAAEVNVSPTHLSNLFQRYLGVSPAKYITRIRIEECKALLCDGEMSVGEIASAMGYSSIPHFCKQFRQWTGSSPAEFAREKHA